MDLSNLKILSGKNKKKKRLGRGYGSAKGGHTVGKGTKGQKARGKGNIPVGFEGGQVPLYKKIPKISKFKSRTQKDIVAISLVKLNKFEEGEKVNPQLLVDKKVLKKLPKHGIKIIANGTLHKKLTLQGFLYSKKTLDLIEKSGSKIIESNA